MQRMQHSLTLKKALFGAAFAVSITACSTTSRPTLAVDNTWQPIRQSERSQQLSELLTAEFTLQRQGSQVAAPLYLQAATDTQDAGVAKRATTTAMVSERNEAVLNATEQWLAVAPHAKQAYPVRLQALLLKNDINEVRGLLKQALENDVSLSFLPEFVDQNARNTEITSTLHKALSTSSLTDNVAVQTALMHLTFLTGDYQTIVDTIDPLLKRVESESQPASDTSELSASTIFSGANEIFSRIDTGAVLWLTPTVISGIQELFSQLEIEQVSFAMPSDCCDMTLVPLL